MNDQVSAKLLPSHLSRRAVVYIRQSSQYQVQHNLESQRRHSIRSRAAAIGREIGVFSRAEIYCRPTQAEAFEYYRYAAVENADWGAVEGQLAIFGGRRLA